MSTVTTEFVDAEYCLESIKSTLSKLSAIDFDEYEEADLILLERMFETFSGRIDKFKTLKVKELEATQAAEQKAVKEASKRLSKLESLDKLEACISTISDWEIELLMIAYGCETVQQ